MRLIGAALVTAAGALAGLLDVQRMRERAQLLEELVRMLDMIEYELSRFRTPLPELFGKLAGQMEGRTGLFCGEVARGLERLGERDMAGLWRDALALLPREAAAPLVPLGPLLGRYGAEELVRAAAGCGQAMERERDRAWRQLRERGRVTVGLSAAGAAALAVLLLFMGRMVDGC